MRILLFCIVLSLLFLSCSQAPQYERDMSFSFPYKHGHIIQYNYKHAEFSSIRPVSEALQRHTIAAFGHGLSYTSFEYSDLTTDKSELRSDQTITASVTVTNIGDLKGKEAILWFISDEFASITRPVKELRHFEKIELNPGESISVSFEIDPTEDLSFPDRHGKIHLERGGFRILVGGEEIGFELK